MYPWQRLEQRKRIEDDLRGRIEQLEKRQTQSDDVLTVINRYWNQFNEDIRLMLQRFDAETADESETKSESAVHERENECHLPKYTLSKIKSGR